MDVWKIGVHIGLSNGMSPVLAIIAGDLLGIKAKAGEVEQLFGKWNTALAGAGALLAGGAILDGMAKLIDHGNELVHVQQQMVAAGVNQADIASATAESWKVASDYGLKVSSVLADIKESRLIFGSTEHAQEYVSELEKMRVVLNAMHEGSGNSAMDSVYQAGRAGELKSLIKPEDFMHYFDEMTKVIAASGGKIDANAYMQATQYGRLASKGWDEQFATRYLPSLIQELGPSGAGTSLMSLFGTIDQGKVSKRSLGMMEDLGLVIDPSKIEYDRQGNAKGARPGAFAGTDLFVKDPYSWAQQILKPLMETKLGHELHPGDQDAIQLLGGMFGSRTSAQAIATLLLESQRINKDANLIGMAPGTSAAQGLLENDPDTAATNFKNSWDNLLTAFGSPMVQIGIDAMNSVANVMKSITGFAVAHPEAIKLIEEAIIGIGVALVGLGGAAIVAAALSVAGPIAGTVVVIGTIISSIALFNWKGITDTLSGIYNAIADFINKMTGLATSLFGTGAIPRPKDGAPAPQYSAPGPGGRGIHPTSYPTNDNQPTVIHTALNVDGRTLAKTVSYHMAANSPGNTGSSTFDGRAMWAPTDVSNI